MYRKHRHSVLLSGTLLIVLMTAISACQPKGTPEPVEVIEEPIIIDETEPAVEEEPVWSPELAFRLEHALEGNATKTINSVAFTHDGSQIATAALHEVYVWDAATGSLVRSMEIPQSTGDGFAITRDDQAYVTSIAARGVWMVSAADGEEIFRLNSGYDSVLDISQDGDQIVTGNRDGVVWLWQAADGERLAEMDPADYEDAAYSEWLSSIAFSPDGQIIAAGHWDGTIFLWDASDRVITRTLTPEEVGGKPEKLSFSVDGQYLAAAGGADGFSNAWVVRIWNVSDGSLYQSLAIGPRNEAVAFSPDGTLLAAGDREGVTIWSYPDFELLYFIPNEKTDDNYFVTDLVFSPNSQFLVAGYSDHYALVWQVKE